MLSQPWKTYLIVVLIVGLLLGAGIGWVAKPVPPPEIPPGMVTKEEYDAAISEREAERDAAMSERDAATSERDAATSERDAAMSERDAAISERDSWKSKYEELAAVEYTIGLAIAVSGPYAVEGPFRRDAALLAIDHMNELLEASGSPARFVAIHEDSKGTTEGALAALEALMAAGTEVVVGPLSSGEVSAIKSFCDANKIVSISPSSTSPKLAVPDDYIFRMCPTDIPQAKALSQLLGETGYTKVAIIGRADDYGVGIADLFEELFTANYGGTVKKLMYTVPAPDYATEVGELSSMVSDLGVDPTTAVLIIAFDDDGLNILGHARLDPTLSAVKWFGSESLKRPSFIPPDAPTEIGDYLVGVELAGLFASPAKGPVVVKFEEAYRAKYGKDPTPYSYFAYDSAWVACLSVLTAAKYDGETISKVVPRVCENYLGASGYKKLNENGDVAGADYVVWKVVLEAGEYKYTDIGVWSFTTEKLTFF